MTSDNHRGSRIHDSRRISFDRWSRIPIDGRRGGGLERRVEKCCRQTETAPEPEVALVPTVNVEGIGNIGRTLLPRSIARRNC